jgi:FixJ family two-component response regulator
MNSSQHEPIVYVVDDDSAVRKSMEMVFSSAGFQSEVFDSAEDFLHRADRNRHGCLLLDVRMSGLGGMELLEQLSGGGSSLPVIMVTAHGHIPMSVQAVKLGAVNFFEKPFKIESLIAAVRDAFTLSSQRLELRSRLAEIEILLEPLSSSELDVLDGLVGGKGHKEIANELGLSLRSIEYRKSSISRKLGAGTRAEMISIMREHEMLKLQCPSEQRLA